MTLLMGAVAYDAKVVPIWSGFRSWFLRHGLPFDFVLYSTYERQVEDLVAGRVHAAWNSPLAWIRAQRLAAAQGCSVSPLVMRDTDRDLRSVVVVRSDSGIFSVDDLKGRTVGTGAVDSPQATLLPLHHLRSLGGEFDVRRFEVGVGLHGDHIGGEREAARALMSGDVAAACLLDADHLLFSREGTLPAGSTRILTTTEPYDHCNMTVVDTAPEEPVRRFGALLTGMSYADPEVRPLLDLEGLTAWVEGRTTGYGELEAAVDACGFYDRAGRITADGYRP
ncbi:phosphate/phosphite/phosphonate ABC transporter substrate-binding protein [Nonomuraea cavernae]|uniref:phosphate/phosphite/phosphonate ABC transporter substrate-binding protein n=1 Tax=Nonomuraea cavernae TaxID=2045107 RepID=UPI0033F4ED64